MDERYRYGYTETYTGGLPQCLHEAVVGNSIGAAAIEDTFHFRMFPYPVHDTAEVEVMDPGYLLPSAALAAT
ncbi:hypothetical protein D9M69_675630 [compost metagenome]